MPAKRLFDPSDVWSLRQVMQPDVSPDGSLVAFVVGVPDRDTDRVATSIWIAQSDGARDARPFTVGAWDTSPRWSPDGKRLAFVRGDGEEGGQVCVARLDGGEPWPVTAVASGLSSPAWSPDGRRLAYVAQTGEYKKPSERNAIERSAPTVLAALYNRYDNVGRFDGRRKHIFVVDLPSDAGTGRSDPTSRQVTDGDWDDTEPAWSPDGTAIAFVSDRSQTRHDLGRRDVWVVPATGRRRPRRLTRGRGDAASPAWSPDGSLVSYVGHEHPPGMTSGNSHLMVVPPDASAPPRSLTAALDRTVSGLIPILGSPYAWSDDGAAVLLIANDRGTLGIYRAAAGPAAGAGAGPAAGAAVDPAAGAAVDPAAGAAVPALVCGGERQILTLTAAGGTVAFVALWPSELPELSCVNEDGSGERPVSAVNAELRATVRLAPVQRVSHRAADGTTIESFVLRPPGSSRARGRSQPAPAVLEIHGGPHGWHPQASMTALYQALAAAGYVVLLPNPRGSHGYGEDFAGGCVGDWGGADFDDLMGAVDALVDRGIADPTRLYVAGYSFGGFMTTWTVGHTERFRAACVSAPVANLLSMWGTTDIPFFSEFEAGGSPWERPGYYADRSPVTYLPKVTTPVQVLHWDGDLRCPIGQGEEVFQGLRKLGKEAVMVRYPGGFHVRRTPSQMEDFVRRHLEWFAAH